MDNKVKVTCSTYFEGAFAKHLSKNDSVESVILLEGEEVK